MMRMLYGLGLRKKVQVVSLFKKLRNAGVIGYRVDDGALLVGDHVVIPAGKAADVLTGAFEMDIPEKKVVAKVGIMDAVTTPGPDGEFGTDDDDTTITVHDDGEEDDDWEYQEIDGEFHCRYCDKVLKTENGMKNHVASMVCRED